MRKILTRKGLLFSFQAFYTCRINIIIMNIANDKKSNKVQQKSHQITTKIRNSVLRVLL